MKNKIRWVFPLILAILLSIPTFYWIYYESDASDLSLFINLYNLLLVLMIAFYGFGLVGHISDYKPKDKNWTYLFISNLTGISILALAVVSWRLCADT